MLVACRESGLGKNVAVGCCLGGRKRQRAMAGGGRCPSLGLGEGAGAECGLSLQRNIPSRNSSHPPPSPSSSPRSCPLGGLESGQVFRPKDPVTSHLLPWRRTVRSRAALPIRRGWELAGRAMGAGMSSAPGPRASYSRLTCSKNRALSK